MYARYRSYGNTAVDARHQLLWGGGGATRQPLIVEVHEDDPRAAQPGVCGPERGSDREPCGVQLRPHQLALLARCVAFEANTIPLRRFPALYQALSERPSAGAGTSSATSASAAAASAASAASATTATATATGHAPSEQEEYLRSNFGVLGDKAGSGKSYVILSLIVAGRDVSARHDPIVRSFAGNRIVVSCRPPRAAVQLSNLTVLVVPHNLCAQWERYIRTFGCGLRAYSVNRTRPLQRLIAADGEEESPTGDGEGDDPPRPRLTELDVLLVTGTYYNSVARLIGRRRVRRVVFDEADSLSIPSCAAIDSAFTWFATASFRNLLQPWGSDAVLHDGAGGTVMASTGIKSTGFMRNVFSDLTHTHLAQLVANALVVRANDAFVDASICLPPPRVEVVPCRAPAAVHVLSGVRGVDRSIIQFLNAGDVQSALQQVSNHNRGSEDNIIAALMDKLAREERNLQTLLSQQALLEYASEAARDAERERLTRRRDELRGRMDCIRERVKGAEQCCICYDDIKNKTVVPCCQNAYCFACITRWVEQRSRSCPLCKAEMGVSQLLVVREDVAEDDGSGSGNGNGNGSGSGTTQQRQEEARDVDGRPANLSRDKSKLANLEAILRARCQVGDASGSSSSAPVVSRSKVLVFSSFDNSFVEITAMMDRIGLPHRFLKGNCATLSHIEREYRTGALDVLLVNTSNYGSGLNLENTTDIVMLHKFDNDIEHQVIGRAQRCGRSTPLNVWYLLYDNEIQQQQTAA